MPGTRIIFLCIAAAVLYGLVHDQFTARICIEYFTIAHPRIIHTTSPTLIALYWGFAATWWVGLLLGIPLAIACRAGSRPRLAPSQLIRPIGILLLCMAGCALIGGIAGYLLTSHGIVSIGQWQTVIPPAAHARFCADLGSHLASYASGFLGGIVMIIWAVRRRGRLQAAADAKPT